MTISLPCFVGATESLVGNPPTEIRRPGQNFDIRAIVIQSSGKIVLGGRALSRIFVARPNSQGSFG